MFDIDDLFSGGKQLAGLDIGSSCIKLAEIQDSPKGRILSLFSQMPLVKGVIVDGAVVEPEALTATIKKLYKQSRCKSKKIVTSISGHAVIVKKATFAQMDEENFVPSSMMKRGSICPSTTCPRWTTIFRSSEKIPTTPVRWKSSS